MEKRFIYTISFVLMLVIATGCSTAPQLGAEDKAEAPMEMEAPVASESEAEAGEAAGRAADRADIERLIIRNASLDIVVSDTEGAVDEIKMLVNQLDGYIVESNVNKFQEGLRANLRIRVPAEKLDQALEQIRDLSIDVERESISGQDVTEEYVDLQSRLRYLEATEERLLEFLEDAEDTEAALSVYSKLQNIQSDIEQVKGRMEYLKRSAAMATISLNITPDELAQPIQVGGWHPEGTLRDAFESLIRVLQFIVDALIVIVVLVMPVLLIITLPLVGLYLLVRAFIRRRRSRKERNEEQNEEEA